MPAILIKYSFLWASLAAVVLTLFVLWRNQSLSLPLKGGVVLLVAAGLAGLFLLVRPTPTQNVDTLAEVDAAIGNGTPTLLELYSEY